MLVASLIAGHATAPGRATAAPPPLSVQTVVRTRGPNARQAPEARAETTASLPGTPSLPEHPARGVRERAAPIGREVDRVDELSVRAVLHQVRRMPGSERRLHELPGAGDAQDDDTHVCQLVAQLAGGLDAVVARATRCP